MAEFLMSSSTTEMLTSSLVLNTSGRWKTRRTRTTCRIVMMNDIGRRSLLPILIASVPTVNSSREALLQKYLKKSEENKAKNDKQRLDDYYKRNYKDYFDYVGGALKGKKMEELTETEKGILKWLEANK